MIRYYPLSSPPQTIITNGPPGSWDQVKVHTLSVVELTKDGFRFWGYYTGYDGVNIKRDIGLARSNDLENWEKYEGNPVINNLRWGTVVLVDGIIHLFGTRNYSNSWGGSYLVRLTSPDGVNFTEQEVIVLPVPEENNQNPFIFYDRNSNLYRLYWFNDRPSEPGHPDYIKEKHSLEISQLASACPTIVKSDSSSVLAAPSIVCRDGKYWLTAETMDGPKWATIAFVSDHPTAGFEAVENLDLLKDNDACYFQYVFDRQLNGFYSHQLPDSNSTWHLRRVFSDAKAPWTREISCVQEEIAGLDPNPYYLTAYREAETGYWEHLPKWVYEDSRNQAIKKCLDLGCAYGTLALFCKKVCSCKVYCTDLIPYLSSTLIKKHDLVFKVHNLELDPWPWQTGNFDLIIFTEVLEHLNFHPVPTLKKIHRLLAQNGRLYLSTPDAARQGRVTKYYAGIEQMPAPKPGRPLVNDQIYVYSREELENVLAAAGFKIERFGYATTYGNFNLTLRKQ